MGLMRNYPRVMNDPYAMPTFTQLYWSPAAVATLGAGYVGSSVVGFLLVVSERVVRANGSFAPVRTSHERSDASPHCRVQGLCSGHTFCPLGANPTRGSLDVSILMKLAKHSAYASIIFCEAILIGLWFGDHGNVSSHHCES